MLVTRIAVTTLNADVRYLSGFQGGPETHLAVMRGEADATIGIDQIMARHLETGDLKRLLWLRHRGARGGDGGVPTVDDIGHPELANLALYRMFAAPPGMAQVVRAKLTEALQQALADPELQTWAQTTGSPLDPGTPEQARRFYLEQKAFMLGHIEVFRGK